MLALVLTLVGHALAPLIDWALRAQPRVEAIADPLVRGVVALIVLGSVLPEGIAAAGWPAVVVLIAGVALGFGLHALPGGHASTDALAAGGWLVHNAVDGVVLASSHHGALGYAVVLHTLPVAVTGWRLARHEAGPGVAGALLAAAAATTVLGWAGAEVALVGVGEPALALVQCGAAGVLLHLLMHVSGVTVPPIDREPALTR